jgi:hypothetical protein
MEWYIHQQWANTELRIKIARDQAGLFAGGYTGDQWESYKETTKLIKPMPKTHSMNGKPFELLSALERLAKTQNSRELEAAQVPLFLLKPLPKRKQSLTPLVPLEHSMVDYPPLQIRATVSVQSSERPLSVSLRAWSEQLLATLLQLSLTKYVRLRYQILDS